MGQRRGRLKRPLLVAILAAVAIAGIAAVIGLYHLIAPDLLANVLSLEPSGKALNEAAWKASYTERGLEVPEDGPREGYWGARLGAADAVVDPDLGTMTGQVDLPGIWQSDALGRQQVPARGDPHARIVIFGGSVAEGAYASSIARTYFSRLSDLLHERGLPVAITVVAGGGWTSDKELIALRVRGFDLHPHLAVFLDGLNDLTEPDFMAWNQRVPQYLDNLKKARDLAREHGVEVVFALQPSIHQKKKKTPIEERIIALSRVPQLIAREYPRLPGELSKIASAEGAHFIDCSRIFDDEPYTTVADIWHFSDPGHELLAQRLADGLAPILDGLRERRARAEN